MPHKVSSETRETWSRLLDPLQHALKDLEYAAITDNHSRIESSTALISSVIRSTLEATEASEDLDLHGSLGLIYRLKFEIPHTLEELQLLSRELSTADLQAEAQEREVQKLLSFTPQMLSLIRDFVSEVDDSKIHSSNAIGKSTSHLTFFRDYITVDVTYDSEGKLVGASITALIEEMTPHDHVVNSEISSTFFLTFRLFSSPMEVLEGLISRWNLSPPYNLPAELMKTWKERKLNPIRFRVINVVWQWVTRQWEPETDDEVLPALHAFLRQCEASFKSVGVSRIFQNLIEYRTKSQGSTSAPKAATQPIAGQRPQTNLRADYVRPRRGATRRFSVSLLKRDPAQLSVNAIEPTEIAHQLTLIESKLFQFLKPKEILRMAQGHHTENVLAVLSLSADITDWVSESILNEFSSRKRTASIKFFIKIAHACLKLQNFASVHSILKALNSPALVPSLDSISSELPYKQRSQLQVLNDWDTSRNSSQPDQQSRRRLTEALPPAVPILGLYGSDIIASLNNNPSHLGLPSDPSKNLLNFGKYRKIAEITQEITLFQTSYSLIEPIEDIQRCLYSNFKRISLLGESASNIPDPRRRSMHSTNSLKRSHSLGSIDVDLLQTLAIVRQGPSINPSVTDIATIYSVPSSRTASTNYGMFYTRHAPSQDSFVGQQWWADLEDSD